LHGSWRTRVVFLHLRWILAVSHPSNTEMDQLLIAISRSWDATPVKWGSYRGEICGRLRHHTWSIEGYIPYLPMIGYRNNLFKQVLRWTLWYRKHWLRDVPQLCTLRWTLISAVNPPLSEFRTQR
jgi:hypothetical protein